MSVEVFMAQDIRNGISKCLVPFDGLFRLTFLQTLLLFCTP